MAHNIEIKARIEHVEAMHSKVAALADHGPIELQQDDTFFPCARGRLKLRRLSAHEGQLIFYQRANYKSLLGVIRASHCRFRRVSFDYPLGNEADWSQ